MDEMKGLLSTSAVRFTNSSRLAVLEEERSKGRMYLKHLEDEARKARLKVLYDVDNGGSSRKTREQFKEEFRKRIMDDASFIPFEDVPMCSHRLKYQIPKINKCTRTAERQTNASKFQELSELRRQAFGI